MISRKPLTPNNRKKVTLGSEFTLSIKNKSPNNKPTAFAWARRGRQNSEGFGGGNRVGR